MDIRRWLDDTADREPPDADVPPGSLQLSNPQNLPVRPPPRRNRRKRQRASSDSSIIVPPQCHSKRSRRQPRVQAHSSTPSAVENACGAEDAGADAYSSSALDDPKPSVDAVHEHAYTRKARHKTNPGHYEPKSRKQRRELKARNDSRSRPRHRKSHRSGDGGRATGLVQSFQLKNGPKGGRLTLKPEITTGLFKHGRASAQVAGRGGGLPDLAFNEMRFLQKPKDHQDAVSGNQAAKGPTKKDRKHAQDEEISAYFAAQRRDPDGKQHDPSRIGSRQRRRKDSPIQGRQASPPPVELPEKPFLGFGSKGTQQDCSGKHDQSTSHYSWSESAAPARAKEGKAPTLNAAFATEKSEETERPNTLITNSIFDSLIALAAVGDDDKENKQPDTSSPTGKLLKRARDALSQPTAMPVKIGQGHHSANAGLNVEDQLTDTGGLHMPERRLQFLRGDDTAFGQKGRQYERPSLEQRIFRGPTREQIGDLQCGMAEPLLRTQNMSSDAEMLDNGNDAAPLELYDSYVYADAEKNDDFGQTWQFERSTGFLDSREQSHAPVSRLSGGRIQGVPTLSDTGRARAIRGLSIEIDNESSRLPTLGAAAEGGNTKIHDGLAGFWKPHRLY
ncbi:hypothetical protein KC351_g15568 [Hortaea werneckii]|nr:hypothetical protein KC351_g15568 [Hortaea werneckii]